MPSLPSSPSNLPIMCPATTPGTEVYMTWCCANRAFGVICNQKAIAGTEWCEEHLYELTEPGPRQGIKF